MKKRLIEHITALAAKNKNVILLTGDLGFGVLDDFEKNFPDQYINCGIAEQNMVSVAAGLGLNGKIVFVYSIGNFPTLRCLEQLRNDCCYHGANVKIICVGGGLCYGALGMSHHATEDIAIIRALPDIRIYSPASGSEVDAIFNDIIKDGTAYIRLGKGGESEVRHPEEICVGAPWLIERNFGARVLILATGSIVEEAITATNQLNSKGIAVDLATFPILKPIDFLSTSKILNNYSVVVTLEEHNINGGLFGIISEFTAKFNIGIKLIPIALNDLYPSVVGTQKFLRKIYNIGNDAIVKAVEICSAELIGEKP